MAFGQFTYRRTYRRKYRRTYRRTSIMTVPITPAELQKNNLATLRRNKLLYKSHLTTMFAQLGYVFIIVLYLKNMSFIRFGIRMLLHMVLSNPFPKDYQPNVTPSMKKNLTKSFLLTLVTINALWFCLDMITGVPHTDNENGFFHGSLTLQIIGETHTMSRWSYLYYNTVIFMIQFITLYLSCLLDTDEDITSQADVLPGSNYSLNQVEGDGYSGRSLVCTIHPVAIFNTIMDFPMSSRADEQDTSVNGFLGERLNISRML